MRFSIINSVFHKELTELLRHRRSLIVMFGVPLLLYPILTIALSSVQQSKVDELQKRPVHIALVNITAAPHLADILRDPDYNATTQPDDPDSAAKALKSGAVDAVITAPPNFQTDAIAGHEAVELHLDVDGSRPSTPSLQKRVDKAIDAYQNWIIQQR